MDMIADLGAAGPEIFLAVAGIALLMVGVFRSSGAAYVVGWLAAAALAVTAVAVSAGGGRGVSFNGMFVNDDFTRFAKIVTLIASACVLVLGMSWFRRDNMDKFEFPVVALFSTLGMLMMISANNMMSLYMGLELQSLAAYVLASFRSDALKSAEAGLKYFVLGAVASAVLLYGTSFIYGFSGTVDFSELAVILGRDAAPIGVVVGLVFVICGLAFKISAAPFHMWTPDVYEGAPGPATAFFAVGPKVAAVALLIRLLSGPFVELSAQWQQVLWVISVASMLVGAFGAIGQTNIKRLLAYSSIGNMGYVLVAMATASPQGTRGALIYLALYAFMTVGAFAVVLSMRQNGRAVEGLDDLAGLSRTSPALAAALAIFLFSMAGIPPLAGFFSKLYVFLAAVDAGLYALAIIGVLSSVVAAFYYIRVVKIMYFDAPRERLDAVAPVNTVVLWGSGIVVSCFWLFPGWLISQAQNAARVLFAAG